MYTITKQDRSPQKGLKVNGIGADDECLWLASSNLRVGLKDSRCFLAALSSDWAKVFQTATQFTANNQPTFNFIVHTMFALLVSGCKLTWIYQNVGLNSWAVSNIVWTTWWIVHWIEIEPTIGTHNISDKRMIQRQRRYIFLCTTFAG